MTISTQVITPALMKLVAGDTTTTVGTETFKSVTNVPYYKITGTTAWKGEDGVTYTETITAYKAIIRPTYSGSYSGDGDPRSIDINIELMEDDTNGMISFVQAEATTSGDGGGD